MVRRTPQHRDFLRPLCGSKFYWRCLYLFTIIFLFAFLHLYLFSYNADALGLIGGRASFEWSATVYNIGAEYNRGWREDGIEEGIVIDRHEQAIEAAKNLLKMKLGSYEQIAQAENLTVAEVQNLAAELENAEQA